MESGVAGRFAGIVVYYDVCSKIGNIGYTVECQWFNRQHSGNIKSNQKLHYRYRDWQIRVSKL
jgi:hypothetical protein